MACAKSTQREHNPACWIACSTASGSTSCCAMPTTASSTTRSSTSPWKDPTNDLRCPRRNENLQGSGRRRRRHHRDLQGGARDELADLPWLPGSGSGRALHLRGGRLALVAPRTAERR